MTHEYECHAIFLCSVQTVIACSLYCFCGQFFCNSLIKRCAGRRTEQKRIGDDRTAEQTCDGLVDLQPLFAVHLEDDRCRTAQRLVTEEDRSDCLHGTQTMVVNQLQDIGILDAVYRLAALIVIDQNHVLAARTQ